jgi:hypothetical protein
LANIDQKFVDALSHQQTLRGKYVSLEPLQLSHVSDLNEAAADGELWHLSVTTVPSKQGMLNYVEHALRQRDSKLELPFVVRRLSNNRVVGTTRYYQIKPEHRNFSIGYTWCREFLPSRG